MQNKSARFSKLRPFPLDIVNALKEDEINLDSVLRGKFASGKTRLAWLACGPHLEVTNTITAERISAYHFSGVTDQPSTVVAVKDFSWQKKTGLLVGLKNADGSVLCLYNVGISKVVKAVVLPGAVTALEPIINHGGASASTQHLHQSLRWFFGVAAAVTDAGHILLIDLCLDDVASSQDELEASDLEMIRGVTTEIPRLRENATREHRHLCLELQALTGAPVSTISYISRTNQLAVGFSDGYLSLWNMKTLRLEYHTQIEGGRVPIFAVTFQEPENDPRHCCYLWVVQCSQSGDASLHLLQMAFGDRRCLTSGNVLYENLEYCEERYSLDLSSSAMSLGEQATSIRMLSCQTIEKFCAPRDCGIHEVTSPETSVSVFGWQMNYESDISSIYLGVFDINRWYQAQMPDSLRQGQFLLNCSYFAFWSLDELVNVTPDNIIDILVQERSLNRGPPPSYPPPEQFFFPSTYNFDAICLLNSGIVHVKCMGSQKQTLGFLKKPGYCLKQAVPESFKRCLVAGLVSPRQVDMQHSNISEDEKLQAILSTAVDTSSHALLTNCIKQWNVQTSQTENLRLLLQFTWSKLTITKEELDKLCVPLFDGSCNFIDPQTLQSLQRCHLRFRNLTSILNSFIKESTTITPQGLTDLTNKQIVGSHLTLYTSVVLWFCRVGLLPDNAEESLQLTRPYYDYQRMEHYYSERRRKMEHLSTLSRGKWNGNSMMIDGMINQFGNGVQHLWTRDGRGTGKYPPSSIHALLDLYLLETTDEMSKHAITVYFLLDVMYSLPDKPDSAIDSFPSAFSLPPGLIKLTQGFWLLDHNDSQNAIDCILHPSSIRLVTWQHSQIIETLMCLGDHKQAMRYVMVVKPPTTTAQEVKMHMTVFLTNGNIMEAWNLQRDFSTQLNITELLKDFYEICSEMGLMGELMKVNMTPLEQDVLQKFLGTAGNVRNQEMLLVHYLQRANYTKALQLNQSMKNAPVKDCDPRLCERTVFRNAMLNQLAKFIPGAQQSLDRERADQKSYSRRKEFSRPEPLSTVTKPAKGSVVTKSSFIKNVLSKIKEVALACDETVSPDKSPGNEESSSSNLQATTYPEIFFSVPLSKLRKMPRFQHALPAPEYNGMRSPTVKFISSSPDRSTVRAAEFSLLETPVVVKRAKALATTTNPSYIGFTPQSILRSTIRTTPPASLSTSPRRSLTPPLLPKETKISFMEEIGNQFSKSVIAPDGNRLVDSPVSSFATDLKPSETKVKSALFPLSATDKAQNSQVQNEKPFQLETSKEINVSARSDETTLEYHDAQTPEDHEGDVVADPCCSDESEPMEVEMADVLEVEKSFHIESEVIEKEEAVPPIHDADHITSKPADCLNEELNRNVDFFEPCPPFEEPVETTVLPYAEDQAVQKEVQLPESGIDLDLLLPASALGCVSNFEHLEHQDNSEFVLNLVETELNTEGEHFVEQNSFSLVLEVEEHVDKVQQSFENTVKDTREDCTVAVNHEALCEDAVEETPISGLVTDRNIKCTDEMSPNLNEDGVHIKDLDFPAENSHIVLKPPSPRWSIKKFSQSDSEEKPSSTHSEEESTKENDFNDLPPVNLDKSPISASEKPLITAVEEPDTETDLQKLVSAPSIDSLPLNDRVEGKIVNLESNITEETGPKVPSTPTRARRGKQKNEEQVGEENLNIVSVPEQPSTPTRTRRGKQVQKTDTESESAAKPPTTPTRGRRARQQTQEDSDVTAEETASKQPSTPTRSLRSKLNVQSDQIDQQSSPNRALRGKLNIQSEQIDQQSSPTRTLRSKLNVQSDQIDQQSSPPLPPTPTRGRRKKVLTQDQIKEEDESDPTETLPPAPSRITRSKNIELENVTSSNKGANDHELNVITPMKGRRARRPVNELVKHFELSSSQPDSISPPISPKRVVLRWTRTSKNKQLDEVFLKAIEQNSDIPRKAPKSVSQAKAIVSDIPEALNLDHGETSVTSGPTTKKRKGELPSNSKDNDTPQLPESQDQAAVDFAFATPVPKRRKTKAATVSPVHLEPHKSSAYVFSPPSTRSRRLTRSSKYKDEKPPSTLETGENLPEEPIPRKRGRPPKHKIQEKSDQAAWSPPPVTIQLLSPPKKVEVGAANSKSGPESTTTENKTLKKKRKLLSKPVSRRTLR